MIQTNIYFDEKEEGKIFEYKNKWGISKMETVKRIVREFKEDNEEMKGGDK